MRLLNLTQSEVLKSVCGWGWKPGLDHMLRLAPYKYRHKRFYLDLKEVSDMSPRVQLQ